MGIVIEEMDATIVPASESAPANTQEQDQKPKTSTADTLASGLHQLMRRQLRVKAD